MTYSGFTAGISFYRMLKNKNVDVQVASVKMLQKSYEKHIDDCFEQLSCKIWHEE